MNVDELVRQLRVTQAALEGDLGRPVTAIDIAAHAALPADQVEQLLQIASVPRSFSEPIGDDELERHETIEDLDVIAPLVAVLRALLPSEIEKVLRLLDRHEREALVVRFGLGSGEPRTVQEVGDSLGMSHEQAQKTILNALAKLRHPCTGLEW